MLVVAASTGSAASGLSSAAGPQLDSDPRGEDASAPTKRSRGARTAARRSSPTAAGTPLAGGSPPAGRARPGAVPLGLQPADDRRRAAQTIAIVDAYDDPDDRGRPRRLQRRLRPAAVHDRERLLPQGEPDRRHELSGRRTRAGRSRSRSTSRSRTRSARTARSCSSRRTRPRSRTSARPRTRRSRSARTRSRTPGARASTRARRPTSATTSTIPGVAITASTGDNGYGVEFPAASRYVTAVGGTTLSLGSDGSYLRRDRLERRRLRLLARTIPKPAWQTDTGCARRSVADVSADADPNTGAAVYDSVPYSGQTGWFQVGGTSLSSPLDRRGLRARRATRRRPRRVGPLRPAPRSSTTSRPARTASARRRYLCTARVGYDGPTGLGTPNGLGAFAGGSSGPPPAQDFSLGVEPRRARR